MTKHRDNKAGKGQSNNEINQAFIVEKEKQSEMKNPGMQLAGRQTSKQGKTKDTSADRNSGIATKKIKSIRTDERSFDLLVDGVPYQIRSVPFLFNEELRFNISVNGNPMHVFTWDSELGNLRGIDDNAGSLPAGLEEAISEKLQTS